MFRIHSIPKCIKAQKILKIVIKTQRELTLNFLLEDINLLIQL